MKVPSLLFDIYSNNPVYQLDILDVPKFVYVIPGKPIPLQRPRYSIAHIYDSQKCEKAASRIYIQNQHGDLPLYEGPLQLIVEFYFETPKRTQSANGKFHTGPPDTDNCIKYLCDIAQGLLYKNDSLIAQIIATKLYDHIPRTQFTIKQLK